MRKEQAMIFGAGGHARVVASIIRDDYDSIIFVDMSVQDVDTISEQSFFQNVDQYRTSDIYLGVGDNRIRETLWNRLKAENFTLSNCISSFASIASDATIGEGVCICPGSVVGSQATVGDNTIINTISSLDHDSVLGAHSFVAPGVSIAGGVHIGQRVFLGIKSAVFPNIRIGDNAVVRAGSLLVKDVPKGVKVGGNPAKEIK